MNAENIGHWIRAGLWMLPVYGVVTVWTTVRSRPDPQRDPEAWALFVSSDTYQLSHLIGSTAGTILAIFGVFALGCALANCRSGRLALAAMVMTVAGTALLLVPAVVSTFTAPAIGEAYLRGNDSALYLEYPPVLSWAFLAGLLLAAAGHVLLGAAVWQSRTLPRWAGLLWAAGAVLFYVMGVLLWVAPRVMLGIVPGQASTGFGLPLEAAGAVLLTVAGGWIAWSRSWRTSPAPGPQEEIVAG